MNTEAKAKRHKWHKDNMRKKYTCVNCGCRKDAWTIPALYYKNGEVYNKAPMCDGKPDSDTANLSI